MQQFRERVARDGVRAHIFVYVDDALIVGDSEEETRRASRILEALLAELGLQWAPHKRRGPARVIEFLGMLICATARERLDASASLDGGRRRSAPGWTSGWRGDLARAALRR